MNQDNRNLILAIVCSALLVIGYQIFFELPKQQALEEQALQDQKDLILNLLVKTKSVIFWESGARSWELEDRIATRKAGSRGSGEKDKE